ncbi:MAG: HAMP domain-containing histidine kinase [Clostridiales bacterium]|nr:HAMP domain-containing histidine kinase [Clostridiales bacterium]
MFQRVHFRLAALCAGITIFIILIMSASYLHISEQNLQANSYRSFQNDMNTLLSNLEQQTIITHEWLSKLEDNGKYHISILDNQTPLLFTRRHTEEQKLLFARAWDVYEQSFEIEPTVSYYNTWHVEFPFSSTDSQKNDYYACAAVSERDHGTLQIMILSSLAPLTQQIQRQRMLFFFLNLLAALALCIFSWFFTRRLLLPLKESQKRQTQFLASASHELRTPLAVILSCASAAEQASDSERAHFLSSIQSEGLRMSRLIEDMLLLTRSDTQSWTIQKESTELDTLLLDAFEAFEPMAAKHAVRLLVQLPESALMPCLCDPQRIRQVIDILLHNALSYTPAGGQITLSLSSQGRQTFLTVSDTGIGIPDSEKPHIFQRFYRIDPSRSEKGHFGLGLSIAAELVHAHGGKIQVTDAPGGGSSFTVIL